MRNEATNFSPSSVREYNSHEGTLHGVSSLRAGGKGFARTSPIGDNGQANGSRMTKQRVPLAISAESEIDAQAFFVSKNRTQATQFLTAMYLLGVGFAGTHAREASTDSDLSQIGISDETVAALSKVGITSLSEVLTQCPSELLEIRGISNAGLPELVISLAKSGHFLCAPTRKLEGVDHREVLYPAQHVLKWFGRNTELFVLLAEEMFWAGRSFKLGLLEVRAETPVSMMDLKVRTHNCLAAASKITVGDLVDTSPFRLMQIPNFGFNSLVDVMTGLARVGTFLGDSRLSPGKNFTVAGGPTSEEIRRRQIERIVELLKTGENASAIAKQSGTKIEFVRSVALEHYGSASMQVVRKINADRQRNERRETRRKAELENGRTGQMLRMRAEGETLQSISDQFGITRERVRQILKKYESELVEREADLAQQQINQIIKGLEEGRTISEVARSLGITEARLISKLPQSTAETVRSNARQVLYANVGKERGEVLAKVGMTERAARVLLGTGIDRLTTRSSGREQHDKYFSDDQILTVLKKVSTYAFPVSIASYRELLFVGEISGPSVPTIMSRFGSWRRACELAGVESGEPWFDHYERKWSRDDLERYVCEFLMDESYRGSFNDFEKWLRTDSTRPSVALFRQRLGSWTAVKERVLKSDRMKSLISGEADG